jgi:hypothetical protein
LIKLNVYGQTQTEYSIKGKIQDSSNNPVEFASIAILNAKDSSMVKGTVSDSTGVFSFNSIASGNYLVTVSFIGYKNYISSLIELINDKQPDLGIIILDTDSKLLNEVVIKGSKPIIQRELGKIIINVSSGAFASAKNAIEIIKRSPGLVVSPDGAISVKGLYAPLIMIDGRPTPVSIDELKALPADVIESIEIITNANAKFDGDTRAVVNVKLKRDKNLGLQGSIFGQMYQNQKYFSHTEGINLTYKTKKWLYFGRYSYINDQDYLTLETTRLINKQSQSTVLTENSLLKTIIKGSNINIGVDYSISKKQSLGFLLKGNIKKPEDITVGTTSLRFIENSSPNLLVDNLNNTNKQLDNFSANFHYIGKIGKNENQISFDADLLDFATNQNQNFRADYKNSNNQITQNPTILRNITSTATKIKTAKIDYAHAISKGSNLGLGARISMINTDNVLRFDSLNNNSWQYDASKSNNFVYEENIVAGYITYSKVFNKTSIELGTRLENSAILGNSLTNDEKFNKNYLKILPSVQLQHQISDDKTLSFSYARKLERPSFNSLNPFKYYINPYTFTEGNPFLLPIDRNTFELSYTFKDYTVSIGYLYDKNIFAQMPIQDDNTNIIRYTRLNLDSQTQYNIDFTVPLKVNSWWTTQHYLSVFHYGLQTFFLNNRLDRSAWAYYFNGSNKFTFIKKVNLELSYDYNSPTIGQIYNSASSGTVAIGLQKNILQEKGSIQINFSDIFYSYREQFAGKYQNIDVNTLQKRGTQSVSFRLTYKFGNSSYSRKNRNTGNLEEEKRAK